MQNMERDSSVAIVLKSRNNDIEMKMMVWTELGETECPSIHLMKELMHLQFSYSSRKMVDNANFGCTLLGIDGELRSSLAFIRFVPLA